MISMRARSPRGSMPLSRGPGCPGASVPSASGLAACGPGDLMREVASAAFPGHTRPYQPAVDLAMRLFFLLAFPAALLWGCTPFIPIRDVLGTSALKPTGNIPPEFAEFNNFDPRSMRW